MLAILRHRLLEIGALVLNFVGTLLLSYSFQASSSDFRLTKLEFPPIGMRISAPPSAPTLYSLCVKNVAIASQQGLSTHLGDERGCIASDDNHVAIVTSDHPWAAQWGLILNMLGFAMQAFYMMFRRHP